MDMFTVGELLFFSACALAAYVVGERLVERRMVFRTLRGARTIDLTPQEFRERELSAPFMSRVAVPFLRKVGDLGRRFAPAGVTRRLAQELVYAGSPVGWDAERILAVKLVTTLVMPIGMFLVARARGVSSSRAFLLVLILGFVGYYLPEWMLRSRSGKRQAAIQRALPDALDLLSITVEAGLAFDAALARVARNCGGPLGEEFHRVLKEMQIGKARSEALRDLGDRTTIQELKSFVLSMIQADIFGISVARVLQTQASEMRTKRRQRAEEKAQKLQVKIIFPLITCIFPSLFVVLLGPAALTIYHSVIQRGH